MRSWRSQPGLFLLLAAACAGYAPPPAVAPPPPAPDNRVLRPATVVLSEAEIRAVAELMQLEDQRLLDSARVAELLHHWSPEVRRRAALTAGRVGDHRATPLLREALSDTLQSVAVEAAFALGKLGDTSAVALTALADALPLHPDDSVGVEIVTALAKLGTGRAFNLLNAELGEARSGATARVLNLARREALLQLWRFSSAGQVLNAVTPWLSHADADVRWRAAYAMVRGGMPGAAPHLLRLVKDANADVRGLALRGLRPTATDSSLVRPEARAALTGALHDAEPHVRINALSMLAGYRDTGVADSVARLLHDADANVQLAAAQALGTLREPGAASDLSAVAADNVRRFGVRAAALTALMAVDARAGTAEARRWASSTRWLARWYAARTLGAGRWPETQESLGGLATDADARVARAALGAVPRAADTTAEAYAFYLQGLRARDPGVRAAAIAGIGRRHAAENLPALMDAYDRAQQDSVPDAAIAAVDALAQLSQAGVPVENAFFARFPAPSNPQLRRRIETRFRRKLPGENAEPERHGAAWYENIVRTLVAPVLAGQPAPRLRLVTEQGEITVELAAADAPLTVDNIITLVERGYFDPGNDPDSRRWHRVVPNFVLQDGDPRGDGGGGPGYAIRDEINRRRYERGVLGMALSGPDTGGSQFFITHSPQPHLDGGYTIFGRVVSGMDVADRVVQDDRISRMEIIRP